MLCLWRGFDNRSCLSSEKGASELGSASSSLGMGRHGEGGSRQPAWIRSGLRCAKVLTPRDACSDLQCVTLLPVLVDPYCKRTAKT